MNHDQALHEKFVRLRSYFDERQIRLLAAADALSLGRGGISRVARATGISRTTIHQGLGELTRAKVEGLKETRSRAPGGGRKRMTAKDPALLVILDELMEPSSAQYVTPALRWTCRSTRQLAQALTDRGHPVSHVVVSQVLYQMGYRLQGSTKSRTKLGLEDCDRQFRHIHERVLAALTSRQPVVAVAASKWTLNSASQGCNQKPASPSHPDGAPACGSPPSPDNPGIASEFCDAVRPGGWTDAEPDSEAASLAVDGLRRWWLAWGQAAFRSTKALLVCAAIGSPEELAAFRWREDLQELTDTTGLAIEVCHLPDGTFQWTRIERQLASHITSHVPGKAPAVLEASLDVVGPMVPRA